jgi:hypothetical protein
MSAPVSRIEKEFILNNLLEKKAPVEVRYRDLWIPGLITEVDDTTVVCRLEKNELPAPESTDEAHLFFKFRGARMTFHAKILSRKGAELKMAFPQGIYRDLSRGYERVAPREGVNISFMVQGEKVELNFPKSENFEAFEEPETMPNFDAAKMANLLRAFREKAQTFSSENKIVMFRERRPESFEEKLITLTGKAFLYPQSVNKSVSEKGLILSPRLLNHEEIISTQTNQGMDLFQILEVLDKTSKEKESKNTLQELYSPILYHNYVVGYLYLITFKDGGQRFSQKVIDFVFQFERLLIHSLKVNGYFKGEPVKERVDMAEVVDISASGIQFVLPLRHFDSVLLLFNDLDFNLLIAEREIKIGGRIMRKFNDHGRLYVCVMFLDIRDEDRRFLMESLYGTADTPDFYPSAEDWTV